ncbi:hypothetical protein MHYP_G00128090 [Metynnis hypsauchen]
MEAPPATSHQPPRAPRCNLANGVYGCVHSLTLHPCVPSTQRSLHKATNTVKKIGSFHTQRHAESSVQLEFSKPSTTRTGAEGSETTTPHETPKPSRAMQRDKRNGKGTRPIRTSLNPMQLLHIIQNIWHVTRVSGQVAQRCSMCLMSRTLRTRQKEPGPSPHVARAKSGVFFLSK